MATDKKISELAAALSVAGTDLGVLVHGGVNYKFDYSLLTALLQASITVGSTFTFGTAVPANTFGMDGDVFFKTDTTAFYQKTSGTWAVKYTFNLIADGTVIYGTGVPSSGLGHDQYTYIDTLNGIFYLKTAGAWAQVFSMASGPQGPQGVAGTNGTNGTDGKTIYNGTSNPSNLLGTDGDFYLNTSSFGFFGPKAGGVWGTGQDLTGPAGPGVPVGGTTGQVLKKIDGVNFNTLWGFVAFSEISGNATDNTSLATALGTKVDKVIGKQLSDENYTSAEKSKLAALSEHYKGYFASLSALQAAFPTGVAGDYATVDAGIGVDAQTYIWDVNDAAWILSSGTGAVSSVNSQVGAVVLDTDDIGEGSTNKYYHTSLFDADLATKTSDDVAPGVTNLYFTTARVLATLLAGISFGSSALVISSDSILIGIGKLQAQISALFFAGGLLTGYSSVSGGTLSSSDTILQGLEKLEYNINHIVSALLPTAPKTGTYGASVNDFIPFDTSGGNGIVNLPASPADQSSIGIKHVIQGGTNTVTINCGGSDKFNKTGGSTTLTIVLVNQGMILLYKGGIWYVISDDLSLAALDARYLSSPAFTGSPTAPTQAFGDNSTKLATTEYVDRAELGQNFKTAAKYATAAVLPTVVYNNGTAGVGATLTGVALGALVVDSVTPSVGDRIIVKNQASSFQNGIYVVTTVGSVSVAFVLTRATDFNNTNDINAGDSAFVTLGTLNSTTTWAINSISNPVLGTDPITFAQTAGQGSLTPGTGIAIAGNTISIDTTVTVDKTTAQTLTNKTLTTPLLTATPAANDNSKAVADTEYVDRAIATQAKKTIIGSFQSII